MKRKAIVSTYNTHPSEMHIDTSKISKHIADDLAASVLEAVRKYIGEQHDKNALSEKA